MSKGHRPSRPHGTKAAKTSGKGARVAGRDGVRLWGRHAVEAALANENRQFRRIWVTRETAAELHLPSHVPMTFADNADLGQLVSRDSPHQGIVADVAALPDLWLEDVLIGAQDAGAPKGPILVLDQVTDPHNIGAILRSAAAFDAIAIVTQDRHSPPESGVIGRAASGALEIVPWVRVVNLARALDDISEHGYWRIGLDGAAQQSLDDAVANVSQVALVLGAEGAGLRHNSIQHCDAIARLPISARMESLNVSNAAAIALYATRTAQLRRPS